METLRKPTESDRAMVVQEFRTLIGPELDAAPEAVRRITFLTPASPTVAFCITPYTLRSADGNEKTVIQTPRDIGLNQHYKAPTLPGNLPISVMISAGQSIIAASKSGQADLGIIVEYL